MVSLNFARCSPLLCMVKSMADWGREKAIVHRRFPNTPIQMFNFNLSFSKLFFHQLCSISLLSSNSLMNINLQGIRETLSMERWRQGRSWFREKDGQLVTTENQTWWIFKRIILEYQSSPNLFAFAEDFAESRKEPTLLLPMKGLWRCRWIYKEINRFKGTSIPGKWGLHKEYCPALWKISRLTLLY